jgi:hypothetical protein
MQQRIEDDHGELGREIKPGSMVVHNGHDDTVLGSVERVVIDPQTEQITEIHIRPGRADYLLKVPAEFLDIRNPDRVHLRGDARIEDLERLAIASGRMPPTGTHIQEAEQTAPAPQPEEVIGNTPIMPSTWDGPSTG